jgi:hypothetical protein
VKELLHTHEVLTKDKVPYDLSPYYTLKLAEKSAKYCFTVPHFIKEIESRKLTVLDEDPTLSHFYPPSVELFRHKKEKNEYIFDNTFGKSLEQAQYIRENIEKKERTTEEDKALLWSLDVLRGLNEIIKTKMSGECTPAECCKRIKEQLKQETKVVYSDDLIEKAINKLDEYHLLRSSDVDLKNYIRCLFHLYEKMPLLELSAGRSGYKSVHLIGDATRPVVNMKWSDTAMKHGRKILIIGNTLAEIFGKALGDAFVIDISNFKYAKNYIVIPIDSSGEDACDGQIKNQRLKVTKLIKALAGNPDNKERHPVMVLTGSKKNQDALTRSIGGICHASQEEGEIGQQWNYKSGSVNVFYQNSTISRGLDVDQCNVMFVHDADFAQPFWAAAVEAGEGDAKDILDSIIMYETTNSVLRISPVFGRDELRPKVVIIPRNDLWKLRYLDEQIIGDSSGSRTPDIEDIALLIRESNLAGTIHLTSEGIKVDDKLKGEEWERAVENNTLTELFQMELDRIRSRDRYTEEELQDAARRILDILKMAKGKLLSISRMREMGLKCKDALIRPALRQLYYQGKIRDKRNGKTHLWGYHDV